MSPRSILVTLGIIAIAIAAFLLRDSGESGVSWTYSTDTSAGQERSADPWAAAAPIDNDANLAVSRSGADCTVERLEAALYGNESTAEVMRRRGEYLFPILAASDDAELVLASALLGSFADPQDTIASVERALALAPKHPLVLWQAAAHCSGDGSYSFCSDPQRLANSDAVLSHNGAYWSLIAGDRQLDGDLEGAIDALVRAGSAPEFDYYFADQVVLLERALSTSSDLPYRGRISEALVLLAWQEPQTYTVQICAQRASDDDNWRSACAGFADRLVADGKTILEKRMGTELRSRLAREQAGEGGFGVLALGEDTLDDDLRALFESGEESLRLVEQWLLADDNFAASFVDELVAGGETSAFVKAVGEVERRRNEGREDPCSFAGLTLP
jgi:hypothetical protein